MRKTYPGKGEGAAVEALKGVDLEVKEGDFFGLLGPNGAGKTTIIGIISSLVNKSSGKVKVFDYDIDTHLVEAKTQLGVVPQEFNFNIFEKVQQIVVNQAGYYGLPRSKALERSEKYLKQLGLWEKRDEGAGRLSGGMKRRLMIARALIHEPRLLILDEPTAGVDIELRRSMWDFLRALNAEGTTIILTTHYLEEAESLCRDIAIIDHGEIIENTSTRELISQLDSETFVFDLREETRADDARIERLNAGAEFPARLADPRTLEVDIQRGKDINNLFAEFSRVGLHITSMRNKANRLEELFVKLTEKRS